MSKNVYQPKKNQGFIPPKTQPKKKKNTIMFYVLVVMIVIWSLGSFLSIYSFFKDRFSNNDLHVAKADYNETITTNEYIGSNLTSSAFCDGKSTVSPLYLDGIYNFNFKVDFTVSNNVLTLTNTDFYIYVPSVNETRAFKGIPNYTTFELTENTQARGFIVEFKIGGKVAFTIDMGLNISGAFNGYVNSIVIDSTEPATGADRSYHNMVSYFDNNGVYIRFSWRIPTTADNYLVYSNVAKFDYRLYYLANAIEQGEQFDLGYRNGYTDGLNDNQDTIYKSGYDDGYSKGNSIGYNNGYNAGVESSGSNTFANLLFSVVDAPLKVVKDLLNFEILGTNLSTIFFGFITVSIAMFIVKMFI